MRIEAQPLSLAVPVQEWPLNGLQLGYSVLQPAHRSETAPIYLLEHLGLRKQMGRELGRILDSRQQPFAKFPAPVGAILAQGRIQQSIVPIGPWRFALAELRLGAHVGTHGAVGSSVLVITRL